MNFVIERKMQGRRYVYEVKDMPQIKIFANFTYGLLFRNIEATGGARSYAFRQQYIAKRLLGDLPFVRSVYEPPFAFFENNSLRGFTVGRLTNPYFLKLGEDWMERYAHANASTSYLKNGVQVAISTKRQPLYLERPIYDVALDEDATDPPLLLLLLALEDVVSSPFSALRGWSFSRREYALHEESEAYAPRLLWRPSGSEK